MTQSTAEQLFHFIDDLEISLSYNPGRRFECDNIVLCGVGGSAVSGYFAADCCFKESSKPIRLIRYPSLPSWVGARTLAVISSYSGNTAETMEMYREAKDRGCQVSVVTSGGRLRAAAESAGDHLALLPEGMHPRHAIGFMIGYTLAVLRAAGCPDFSERIGSFIPSLREFRDRVAADDGQARALARRFRGKVPVICADSSMASVAFRWKTQINENSKFVAFCESAPLFNAHAMKGWAAGVPDDYVLVLLNSAGGSAAANDLGKAFSSLGGEDKGILMIGLAGESDLENMFRAIILGDYISMYMAEDRGIDPAEVRPVMQMKAKLSGRLDRGPSGFSRPPIRIPRTS